MVLLWWKPKGEIKHRLNAFQLTRNEIEWLMKLGLMNAFQSTQSNGLAIVHAYFQSLKQSWSWFTIYWHDLAAKSKKICYFILSLPYELLFLLLYFSLLLLFIIFKVSTYSCGLVCGCILSLESDMGRSSL